jgi:methionyl-tRNA synthetase
MNPAHFYITTPIYYVNDKPHIGHAYTTVLADVLARYHRLLGEPTHFLTGTDEHGQKVQQAAEKNGITPRQQADQTVVRFQELWRKLAITNDDFIRTTEQRHVQVVQKILQDLYDRGEIYRAEYDGWYCLPCERFYMDKDLEDGKCPECKRPVDRIKESNYFFRMSAYQEWLVEYIQEHPRFIQPDYRRNETLGFLRKKLNDLCISRPKSRLTWGIELPFDSEYVTYVWFDALVNYISAIGYGADDAAFTRWWPASYHLIGKDILTTHTVYWPTMLKAMNLPMPETVFAHGWWMVGESKMSKSSGNVVNPMELADRYGVEPFRYFLMAEMVLGQDASFSEEAFVRRYNTDLANDIGNLLSRVVKMIATYNGGVIPAAGPVGAEDAELRTAAEQAARVMAESIASMRLDLGIGAVSAAVRAANRYLERRQPWTLAKQKATAELGTVLYYSAETLRIIGGLLYPIMPQKMGELRRVLGIASGDPLLADLQRWGGVEAGVKTGEMTILFPRIECQPAAAPAVLPIPAIVVTETVEGVLTIEYADFQKVQLRTARIIAAEKIAGADKLLCLQIEIGAERRQIVAGIAQHYAPETLPGKCVVVVVNLKPAKIRGIESNAMLLAASTKEKMVLVTTDGDLPSGSVVK